MSLVRAWVPYLMFGPARLRRMIVDLMPFENVQKMRNIINVMDKTSKEVFYAKKHALLVGDENVAQQVGEGKDLMSVLRKCCIDVMFLICNPSAVRENMAADVDVRMSDDELIGQMSYVSVMTLLHCIIMTFNQYLDICRLRYNVIGPIPHALPAGTSSGSSRETTRRDQGCAI